MRLGFVVAAIAVGLAGCQTTEMAIMDQKGGFSVHPSTSPGYDFIISMRNFTGDTFDLDKKADRERVGLKYLEKKCPNGQVVGESEVSMGTYPGSILGGPRPATIYSLKVKCGVAPAGAR